MSPDVGDDVLGFHLVRRLDAGTGAALFRAYQTNPDRIAAVKVSPLMDAATEEAIRRRFVRYVGIDHPNLLPIYAMGAVGLSRVVAMRFVEGGDLAARIRRGGPLAFDHAARVLQGIAAGLVAHLHFGDRSLYLLTVPPGLG